MQTLLLCYPQNVLGYFPVYYRMLCKTVSHKKGKNRENELRIWKWVN